MRKLVAGGILAALNCLPLAAQAQATPAPSAAPPAARDSALAQALGADENGMHAYVMVFLKTGPTPVPAGPARDRMFAGHFGNIERQAKDGKLVVAGPLDGVNGLRGVFVFAVSDIADARKLVATDPVIINGEMVAEYHEFFSSAALMAVNGIHEKIRKR
jgi:uncharacterized protein YciI